MSFSLVHQLTKGDLMSGAEVEAKKTDTLALYSSKAELLEQVYVLQKLFTPFCQLLTVNMGYG